MSRKVLGYVPDGIVQHIITKEDLNITASHPSVFDNLNQQLGEHGGYLPLDTKKDYKGECVGVLSASAFISDERMDKIKDMIINL